MLRFIGDGDPELAPTDARVWVVEDIGAVLMGFNEPFKTDDGEIMLEGFEHKRVFLSLHYMYEDNAWSTEEYFKEVYKEYTGKTLEKLRADGYVGFVMYRGKKCMYVTPTGEDAYKAGLIDPREAIFIEDALDGDNGILVTEENMDDVRPIEDED